MTTVRRLLEAKGGVGNFSVLANATVLEALKVMHEAKIGAVLVTENKKMVGISAEHELSSKKVNWKAEPQGPH